MATVYDVETVLNSTLVDYAQNAPNSAGLSNIVWGNTHYEPETGVPYISADFRPASSAPVGVGEESAIREIGFYQLSVAVPSGDGKATLKQIVSELQQYFKTGSTLSYGGIAVRVRRFRILTELTAGDWYIQVIRVEWRSDIPNQ